MNDDANQDDDLAGGEIAADEAREAELEPELEADLGGPAPPPEDLSGGLTTPITSAKSSAFMGVPIEIIISVGKARPLVSELVKLHRDSVIALDSKIDDPVEIFIGDRLIARGELQEMEAGEGQLGVRLTEVADLSNGV